MITDSKIFDVIVIGAGVAGIYQIKQLTDHGFDSILLEANADLGGTWFKNRYPGCRFDSESYTYGYSFSRELVEEWHWKEHFSSQPENLRYLNYVADKFDLRRHMRFNARVVSLRWNETNRVWTILLDGGETFNTRFVVTCLGVLSVPFLPSLEGMNRFEGLAFHSFDWPDEPLDLAECRVGIIGTGATGIQIIGEIADKVRELTVFQRHPNWSVPLNNSPIDEEEMAEIRKTYDDILAKCERSQGGFVHLPYPRGFGEASDEERVAVWDELYDRPGFALLLANFPETFLEEDANRALSNYVANRIRQRVDNPDIAEKLIPRDHGFGMKRLPLETGYFEAYNRPNVHLVDLTETPIESVTAAGIQLSDRHIDLDVIVYATGFHAITGGLNQIDILGVDHRSLQEKWKTETSTYLGLLTHGFPNMFMIAGPQSVSGSTNYPRAIERGVDWVTNLLLEARKSGITRIEPQQEAERKWVDTVTQVQEQMPFSKVSSWFTGYTPTGGRFRYNAYWGGAPRYREYLREVEEDNYSTLDMS